MKLVYIEWADSHSGRGWQDMAQIQQADEPLLCRSVGWMVLENNQVKILVPHLNSAASDKILLQGCGDMTIPNSAITKFEVLREDT
jgi:hypothetical protein